MRRLGVKCSTVLMALGLEQELFVFTKKFYESRLDLVHTGRLLIGKTAPKNQQFADHYYGKLPHIIE